MTDINILLLQCFKQFYRMHALMRCKNKVALCIRESKTKLLQCLLYPLAGCCDLCRCPLKIRIIFYRRNAQQQGRTVHCIGIG